MSRKDYELIASAFAERIHMAQTFSGTHASRMAHLKEIADTIADKMASDNPRFNRPRFLTACGFDK
jgi:hypothetical protein